jgi:catechol 2,3-dioxygenase-like lactoylglutathione lyase family enzyme
MSSTLVSEKPATGAANAPRVAMKLEVIVIPVSDADRAKRFYGNLGWRLDADYASDDGYFRVIQFTPPGSGCSVILGIAATARTPPSAIRTERDGYCRKSPNGRLDASALT